MAFMIAFIAALMVAMKQDALKVKTPGTHKDDLLGQWFTRAMVVSMWGAEACANVLSVRLFAEKDVRDYATGVLSLIAISNARKGEKLRVSGRADQGQGRTPAGLAAVCLLFLSHKHHEQQR